MARGRDILNGIFKWEKPFMLATEARTLAGASSSRRTGQQRTFSLLLVAWLALSAVCQAEYPAISSVLRSGIAPLQKSIEERPLLVAVRDTTSSSWPWRLRAAIQTEVVAQLCREGAKATDAELDPRTAWLSTETRPLSRTDVLRWKRESLSEQLVFGQLEREGNAIQFRVMLLERDGSSPLAVRSLRFTSNDILPAKNVPELNQAVVKYLRERIGTTLGNGQCTVPALEAVKHAGGKRSGIYIFGREMANHEAIVPGDILQIEQARFLSADGKRRVSMTHHTAIVDEVVGPNTVRILHQNFGQGEKRKTLTALTLHLDELRSGTVAPYRPGDGSGPLPWRISPRRRIAPQVVRDADGAVDLLKTLDPAIDSVRGIWHFWEGPLSCHAETYARLQLPIDAPRSYTLSAEVIREAGDGGFGFGLLVGGRQVLLIIDAGGGQITGFHRLDGKRVNANATTWRGPLLPVGASVQLQIRVTPTSVRLSAGGKPVLDWTGDPNRLSLDSDWEIPRKDWLFLASSEMKARVAALTLTSTAGEQ